MNLSTWLLVAQLLLTIGGALYTLFSFGTGGRVRRWLRYGLGIDEVRDGVEDLRHRSDRIHRDVDDLADDVEGVQMGMVAMGKAINDDRELDVDKLERDVRDGQRLPQDYFADEGGDRFGHSGGSEDSNPMDDD